MKIKVVDAKTDGEEAAVSEIAEKLRIFSPEKPGFLLVFYSPNAEAAKLRKLICGIWPDTAVAGLRAGYGSFTASSTVGFDHNPAGSATAQSSSAGAKSRFSVKKFSEVRKEKVTVFVQAFYDPAGAFGCACRACDPGLPLRLDEAMADAGARADRRGVMPNVVLAFNTQGTTGEFYAELNSIMGTSLSVAGGIVDTSAGPAGFFTDREFVSARDAYLLVAAYTSCDIQVDYLSEARLQSELGVITRAEGGVVLEIDHKPAADMFFAALGTDVSAMEPDEMQRILAGVCRDWFVAYDSYVVEYGDFYNVSVVNRITESRGLALNSSFPPGDRIYLMKASDADMSNCFVSYYPMENRPVGTLHIMCESFCKGDKSLNFNSVVDRVRGYHGADRDFMVFSAAGENVGTTHLDLRLANCTVITVTFLERVRL